MKKQKIRRIISYILVMCMTLSTISWTASAVNEDSASVNKESTVQTENVLLGESVYASSEKQREIAGMINDVSLQRLKEKEWCILVESITPVYCVRPEEFLETGKWELYPSKYYKDGYNLYVECGEPGAEPEVYVAKAIDYKGLNACNVTIYTNDSTAFIIPGEQIEYGGWSRTSYADHAERMQRALAPYDIFGFSEKDVRYTIIMGFGREETEWHGFNYGSVFYVSYKGKEALVNLNAYDGLFYGEEEENYIETQVLTGDKAVERFTELRDKRNAESEYKRLSEKMGIDLKDWDKDLKAQYYDNMGSTYTNENSIIHHVLHIGVYMAKGDFIMMTTYPSDDKLIGTRYAKVEKTTDTKVLESEPVGESEVVKDNAEKIPQDSATVFYVFVSALIALVVGVGIGFAVKKKSDTSEK